MFTRHFSNLTRVEPGLVVFRQQTNPGRIRVSSVYTTETNPGRTWVSLCRVNRAFDSNPGGIPYKKGGDARQEISIDPLKGTNLGVA